MLLVQHDLLGGASVFPLCISLGNCIGTFLIAFGAFLHKLLLNLLQDVTVSDHLMIPFIARGVCSLMKTTALPFTPELSYHWAKFSAKQRHRNVSMKHLKKIS